MHLDFLGDGTATIHMPSYLQSAIDESNLPITKAAATPAAASLLHIESASPLLPITHARTFHSVIAKLIYTGTRACTDILLALGFLCSRVSAPNPISTKTMKAQSKWRATAKHHAGNGPAISISGIFLSRTTLSANPSLSSIALPASCLQTTSPNPFKVPSFVFSVPSSSVSSPLANYPPPHPRQGTRSVLIKGTVKRQLNPNPRRSTPQN
jgi:hypothetical protein